MTEKGLAEYDRRGHSESVGPGDVLTLTAEVRRLKYALDIYGSHAEGCIIEQRNECSCGLWKAIGL